MTSPHAPPRLGVVGQTGYAFGNFGKSVLWTTTEYFLLFYLTELLGLQPVEAGLLIFFSLALDAALGPLVGFAADRVTSPWGKYGPYLLLGAPMVALTFWLLFAMPLSQPAPGLAVVATLLLLFRTAYVICDVPHNALLARLAVTERDAATLSGLRFLFSSIGAFVAALAAGAALAIADAAGRSASISIAAAAAGGAFLLAIWVAFAATHRLDRALPNRAAHIPAREAARLVFANRALVGVFALGLVQVVTLPFFAKGLTYWGAHHHGEPGWSGWALGLIAAAQGVSMAMWIPLGRKWPAIWLARAAYGVVGLSAICFGCAILLDSPIAEMSALIAYGVGHGGAVAALWALLPGAITAGGRTGGPEVESLPTGVFLFVIKAGAGLGTALLGFILSWIGLAAVPGPQFLERLAGVLLGALAFSALACLAATLLVASNSSQIRARSA